MLTILFDGIAYGMLLFVLGPLLAPVGALPLLAGVAALAGGPFRRGLQAAAGLAAAAAGAGLRPAPPPFEQNSPMKREWAYSIWECLWPSGLHPTCLNEYHQRLLDFRRTRNVLGSSLRSNILVKFTFRSIP